MISKSQYMRYSAQLPEFVAEIREQARSELLSTLRDEVEEMIFNSLNKDFIYIEALDDVSEWLRAKALNKP